MNQRNRKSIRLILLSAIFVASALVSWLVNPPSVGAQFIDRITRPCSSGASAGLVQVTTTNILINPCPGGQVTINGVPLVIVPGGGLGDPGANGYVVRTALNTTVARTFGAGTGLSVTNGSGVVGSTSYALANTAVTPGAYTNANITIDQQGRITLAANGGAGVTPNPTIGTVPYLSAATVFSDSPITRLSATHLRIFAAGPGGADFDTSTPSVSLFGAGGVVQLGDPGDTVNGTQLILNDATKIARLRADDVGNTSGLDLTGGATPSLILYSGGGPTLDFQSSGNVLLHATSNYNLDLLPGSTLVRLQADTSALTINSAGGGSATVTSGALLLTGKLTLYNNVAPVDGQVLIGGTAAGNWTAGTISGSAPIVVTNGNNTIAVSCPTCGTGSGTVTGTGTTNKLALWTNGAGGVLGDSPITASGNDVSLAGELTAGFTIRTGAAGNKDLGGQLTVGAGGTITYTFTQTYASAPVCVCSDTSATPSICGASASTTTLTVTSGAGNVVNYVCIGRN